jgi:DNA modification methylase
MTVPKPHDAKSLQAFARVDSEVVYCGDNLDQLAKLPDACVDLVYIDPPFNSSRNYEVFWTNEEKREKRAFEDRFASTEAYIEFMRPRCVELARVLKPTGTLYYHCDWHASHYVKVMLDQIFGAGGLINEIVWKRQSSHNDAKQGSKHLGRVHDTIFSYCKTDDYFFKHLYRPYDPEYIANFYRHEEPETGRRYRLGDLTGPGGAAKGNPEYEFLGVTRFWRYSKERMQELYVEGRIVQTKAGNVPQYKRYLDDGKGVPLGTVWDDIGLVQGTAGGHGNGERVGFPTQKPLKLLERIIAISSKPGDIVLDAFCGCGTALVAAQNSHRRWIGIDISPTACRVMATSFPGHPLASRP